MGIYTFGLASERVCVCVCVRACKGGGGVMEEVNIKTGRQVY